MTRGEQIDAVERVVLRHVGEVLRPRLVDSLAREMSDALGDPVTVRVEACGRVRVLASGFMHVMTPEPQMPEIAGRA